MKAVHINPFLDATVNLFTQMLGSEPRVGQKSLLTNFNSHRWDISGIIGVTGSAEGVVAIRLTRKIVEKMVKLSGLTADSESEMNDLISSMVGEMVNVIAGNALSGIGQYDLDITVPFVVQGKDHTISWPQNNPIITVPFITSQGPVEVNISLKDNLFHSILGEAGLN